MRNPFKSGLALSAAAALFLVGCSPSAQDDEAENGGGEESAAGETITVGIKYDQPGLGFREGNQDPTGFDVDVAKAVLSELGYAEEDIEWAEAPTPQRETLLTNGQVDMIFATYSITDERAEQVDFAGPYFVAGQDILVREDEDRIEGPDDLAGLNLCSVTGSTPAQNVQDEYGDEINLVEQNGYAECLTYLQSGQVDAVTTDDVILAGLAATEEYAGEFRVVGEPFSEERYGIGLPPDSDMCEDVNEAVQGLLDSGEINELLEANTEGVDYTANEELNTDIELESCE